jgi:hypothetical protein
MVVILDEDRVFGKTRWCAKEKNNSHKSNVVPKLLRKRLEDKRISTVLRDKIHRMKCMVETGDVEQSNTGEEQIQVSQRL